METEDQSHAKQSAVSKTNPVLSKSPKQTRSSTSSQTVPTQKVFHPGLFTRTRASSLSEIPKSQETTVDIISQRTDTMSQPLPPDWQRGLLARKRKRVETSPRSDLTTTNRFEDLPLNSNDNIPAAPPTNKPLPMILYGLEDVNKLTNLVETVSNKRHFVLKIINKNLLRILVVTAEDYKKIIS